MKEVMTKDSSTTFYSEEYGETYHSTTGAVEEAFKKFVEPCDMASRAKQGAVRILDVCFGLGYNSAAALDKILENNIGCSVEIIGLEKDEKILMKTLEVKPLIMSYCAVQDAVQNKRHYSREGISIKILLGDARKTICKVKGKFDIILHDPFSPKKNPELWTEDFFKELRKHIKEGGILTTYSCAGQVRRNLKAAGFAVKDGPCVGRRSPSTIATPLPL